MIKASRYDSFEAVQAIWNNLEQEADCFAFQRFDWLSNWYDFVGAKLRISACLVVVEDPGSRPFMLLPLGIERRRRASLLVWLGGKISDYHCPLLRKDCPEYLSPHFFRQTWSAVLASLPPFDGIFFEKMPERIGNQRNPFLGLGCIANASSAHFAELSGTPETFIRANRNSKSISTEKRKARRLKEHGNIEFVIAAKPDEIERILAKTISQKTRSYKDLGVANLFEESGYREFFEFMSKTHGDDKFVHLSALLLDNKILATHWGIVFRKRFYYLLPTYAIGPFTRYSPGNMLLRELFAWCFDNGVETFDFTAGDEFYKSHWCENELRLFDYYQANTMIGFVYIWPLKVARILKRRIKNSPTLMRIAVYLRIRLAHFNR